MSEQAPPVEIVNSDRAQAMIKLVQASIRIVRAATSLSSETRETSIDLLNKIQKGMEDGTLSEEEGADLGERVMTKVVDEMKSTMKSRNPVVA